MKNKLLAGLLAVLGFSSCSPFSDEDDNVDGGGMLMYGVIRESFVVKGKVTDTGDKPIEGIRVVLKPSAASEYSYIPQNTAYSAEDGSFKTVPWPAGPVYSIIAEDVDGEKNGVFKPLEKTFKSNGLNYEDDKPVRIVDFELEENKDLDRR